MNSRAAPVLALVGVTASGKSSLAMELARMNSSVELVSVDSMQVYQEMDIGTAKPSAAEQAQVRHHVIDVVPPSDDFTVNAFQQCARNAMSDIVARGGVPLLVGGTGLHLRSVVDDLEMPGQFPETAAELDTEPDTRVLHRRLAELDPDAAEKMEPTNRRRVLRALEVTVGSGRKFSSFGPGMKEYPETNVMQVGLRWSREAINQRIEDRYELQMQQGFLDEARKLWERNPAVSRNPRQALGYRQLFSHLANEISVEQALDEAVVATRQFARRQERWFRRDPRIVWLDIEKNPMEVLPALMRHFDQCT